MKLDSLKPLLHHDGPLTTVCLDVTRGDESSGDREVRSRWNGMRRSLEQADAPAETIAAIEEVVLRPTHVAGPHGRYVVAARGRVLWEQVLPEPPARDEAFHDGAPSLVPAVAALDEAVRYLLVEVDRLGADLRWPGIAADAEDEADAGRVEHVEGGHDVVPEAGGGGSHQRLQARVQDSWERNAEAVAAELDRVVAEHRPELVPRYQWLYGRGAYVPDEYRRWLRDRMRPLRRRHGLPGPGEAAGGSSPWRAQPSQAPEAVVAGVAPRAAASGAVQPALF